MKRLIIFKALISLVFTVLFFMFWPTNLVWDDAGIILKYMDNFRNGYFYSYNPSDGPVFGISSFTHGLLSGFFAFTHIFSPLNSLFASNFIGLFFVSFLSLHLISRYEYNFSVIWFAWLLLMCSSQDFVCNIKQGMEIPLYLAILLGCFHFYLKNDVRWMFAFFSLAIITKLDSVPIIGMLFLGFVYNNRQSLKPFTFANKLYQQILLYGILPLTGWIVFSFLVFRGPLPQAALAKMYYHMHSSGSWFPFLQPLMEGVVHQIIILGVAIVFFGYALYCIYTKRFSEISTTLIFGLAATAYLLLYYFYNPGERMGWYYAIPEFLMSLQMIVIAIRLAHTFMIRWKRSALIIIFMALLIISSAVVNKFIQRTLNYLTVIESQRIAIGDWIHDHSNPNDTLMAGHGHIARNSGLYTIDFTGINSTIVTDYKLDFGKLVNNFKPRWIVQEGFLDAKLERTAGYTLRNSFYNTAVLSYPPVRVYEKLSGTNFTAEHPITPAMVTTNGKYEMRANGLFIIDGTRISFKNIDPNIHLIKFEVGLIRGDINNTINAEITGIDSKTLKNSSFELPRKNLANPADGFSDRWVIDLQPEWTIKSVTLFTQESAGNPSEHFIIVDPIITE
ncbi:MAG: hypothetical protein ACHQQQ_01615 [Bacteroidota bacterium]